MDDASKSGIIYFSLGCIATASAFAIGTQIKNFILPIAETSSQASENGSHDSKQEASESDEFRTCFHCDVDSCPGKKSDPYDPQKRTDYLSWDDYFMAVAFLSAKRSKDPNRQVGACIVGEDKVILGIGYNGFPRGIEDDNLPWSKKSLDDDPLKTKYPYVCHAEVNAILNRNHASAPNQRIYVTMFPCNECAKMIIQAGIREVVYFTNKDSGTDVQTSSTQPPAMFSYAASKKLLSLAKIKVWQHKPLKPSIVLRFKQ